MTVIFAILAGLIGAVGPLSVAVWPALGPTPLYRLRQWRTMLTATGLLMATLAYRRRPSPLRLAAVLACGAFAGVAQVFDPRRIFVALTDPPHARGVEATLGDDALVLGVAADSAAYAWPLEMVAPHHLINDHVDGSPVLVSY